MTFDEILAQVLDLLQREKRLSYRALKVRFGRDDEHLAALKDEIIEAKQLAVDDRGLVLVWSGDGAPALPATPSTPARVSFATMPAYLTEKIRTTRDTLAGERKQVTVLFADIKDSTELIRGLDPEVAQRLLDPALQHMMDTVHRFEGTVNQVLGDGIMALFGAPIAHEDHALRACYAALAMQAAMRAYTEEVRRAHGLEMRIGLSEAYLLAGRLEDASDRAGRALDLASIHKERGNQAHARRLLGEVAAHRNLPAAEQAEAHYHQALVLADELGMRPLQAHCHRGLGSLYLTLGQREQAHVALSTAIDLYRAMDMAFWLPQAEAMLAQVKD